VRCPQGQVLSYFKYSSSGCWWHQARFVFRCRDAETTPQVHRDGKCEPLRNHKIEYLDRQRPGCEKDEVMTGFHVHASGCHGDEMRFRSYCAKVYQPWYLWGKDYEKQYQTLYRYWWHEYTKKYAEYKRLRMPTSMSGQRVKAKYEHCRKTYDHYNKAYAAVGYQRTAIKYERLWRRYRNYQRKAKEAAVYKDTYKHYHDKFLAATGKPPAPPKVEYPKGAFLGPAGLPKDKSPYWLRIYQDPPNTEVEARHNPDTVRKNEPVVEKLPAPACGDKCRPAAKDLFSKVNDKLAGLLPDDPDWSSFPKALVRDPTSKQAKVDKALSIQAQDPINNADIDMSEGDHADSKAVAEATGCDLGDEECLRKLGVWPGQVKSKKGAAMQTMTGPKDVYSTYNRAMKHLGDLVPDDPNWAEYPHSLVESRKATAYKVKRALDTKVNDPLDDADYGIVDGMDASPKVDEFKRELTAHTGCGMGEKDCVDKFLLTKGVPPPPPAKK